VTEALTRGIHHLGLAVRDLDGTVAFFTEALGWTVVGRNDDYPSAFVSDGSITLTLWRVRDPETAIGFDRRSNLGLHHLALAVPDVAALHETFERVSTYPGVSVEFAPGPFRAGSDKLHCIVAIPDGIRLEFAASN
jgi:catechol 2,3-dioxygenase-like lactoylglutathione lyase family enzyme